jgi:hypothetical protein
MLGVMIGSKSDEDFEPTLPGKSFGRVELDLGAGSGDVCRRPSDVPPPSTPSVSGVNRVRVGPPLTREEPEDDDGKAAPASGRSEMLCGAVPPSRPHVTANEPLEPTLDRTPASSPRPRGDAPRPSRPSGDMTKVVPPPQAPRASVLDVRVAAMRELYATGDADAALFVAQAIPASDGPDNAILGDAIANGGDDLAPAGHEDMTMQSNAAHKLAALTSYRGVPKMLMRSEVLAALPINHRAGFLIDHIDGVQTMEQILDVCAMPESEALALLKELAAMGVISLA